MSENSGYDESTQAPALLFDSDARQYGSYAAGLLRKARRGVALSSSIETKLMAFREAASTLSKAVSDQWLPRNVVENQLYQTAFAHGGFGLGDDQIDQIIADALLDQKSKMESSSSTVRTGGDFAHPLPSGPASEIPTLVGTTTAAAAGSSSWPAAVPISSTLPPVEKFIPELLPDAIRDYVMDVADRQQAPSDFAAVTALCGVAAVIGNRVRIRPKQNDDWEIVPNLWGAIIGRPSAMKSPAMKAALAPIYAIDEDLRENWEENIRTAEIDKRLSSLDAKDLKNKAGKALKEGDREGARGILASLVDDEEEAPCPRIVVNDATVEKLGELLNENPRGLLLIRDELPGLLARLESEEHQ